MERQADNRVSFRGVILPRVCNSGQDLFRIRGTFGVEIPRSGRARGGGNAHHLETRQLTGNYGGRYNTV